MAEWTKDPKVTGAYLHKVPHLPACIVWIQNGFVSDAQGISGLSCSVAARLVDGAMFYGPIEQPPPVPSEFNEVKITVKPENYGPVSAFAAWLDSQERKEDADKFRKARDSHG